MLRKPIRQEMTALREAVVSEMREAKISKGRLVPLEKSVRMRQYRFGLGFLVSVKPHRSKGFHINRRMQEKPVLMWLEEGTKERFIRKRSLANRLFDMGRRRKRKGIHASRAGRGAIKPRKFVKQAQDKRFLGIEERLFDEFQKVVDKAARKKGW